MLNSQDFDDWCRTLNLTQTTRAVVEQIRSADPSRKVQSHMRNVSGSYPSRKMEVTVQFESHRNELARIYELEHDPEVLEYYDQPPPIELVYLAKSGRRNRHQYTPDFFVIRTHSAGWEECKVEPDLVKLSRESPNRYQKGVDSKWHCPPGESYATPFGFYFCICSDADINWIFQQNVIWLEDYFCSTCGLPDSLVIQTLVTTVKKQAGITLAELLQQVEDASRDDIYTLIATGQVYVNLNATKLAEPEQVKVFLNREIACVYEQFLSVAPCPVTDGIPTLRVTVGTSLLWDGQCWKVVNTGMTSTGLLHTNGRFIELPNAALEALINESKITQVNRRESPNLHPVQLSKNY